MGEEAHKELGEPLRVVGTIFLGPVNAEVRQLREDARLLQQACLLCHS